MYGTVANYYYYNLVLFVLLKHVDVYISSHVL